MLKNWSMSIGVVVEARPSSAPSSSAGLLFGPGADGDVVVGDAGEGGGADRRGGAFVQLLVDGDVDLGEVVVGEADAFHRAGRRAADQDLVVGHQLAGVLEDERVLVAAAAAEEDDARGRSRRRPGRRSPRSGLG